MLWSHHFISPQQKHWHALLVDDLRTSRNTLIYTCWLKVEGCSSTTWFQIPPEKNNRYFFYCWCLHIVHINDTPSYIYIYIHMCVSLNCGTPKTGPHNWSFFTRKTHGRWVPPLKETPISWHASFWGLGSWIRMKMYRCRSPSRPDDQLRYQQMFVEEKGSTEQFNMYIYNVYVYGDFIPNS